MCIQKHRYAILYLIIYNLTFVCFITDKDSWTHVGYQNKDIDTISLCFVSMAILVEFTSVSHERSPCIHGDLPSSLCVMDFSSAITFCFVFFFSRPNAPEHVILLSRHCVVSRHGSNEFFHCTLLLSLVVPW